MENIQYHRLLEVLTKIFGRGHAGLDIIHRIENLPRRKNDKPEDPPSIVNIDIS